jgi:Ca-activated chloride channel homolog
MSFSSLQIEQFLDEQPARAADEAGLGALVTARGNLPLRGLDVRAAITGLTVGVELTQTFHNPHDTPLEATYIFPLPDRAAVTALTMTVGDRVIEGVLSERGAAREAYDAAIAAGQQAGIAEEERPDVFTLRVGNILPGQDVTVVLTLAGPLPFADGQAEFRFPLVVAPRYIPGSALPGGQAGSGHGQDTDAVPDASRITPPVLLPGFPNPVELSIEVRIDPAGLALTGIASSLHAVTEQDGLIRIRPGERVNRDFILRLAYEDGADCLVLVPDAEGEGGGGGGEGTYQLTVLPLAAHDATAAPRRPRDLVLLLDRSGSMSGWKMVAARRAAARIVDTLTPADRFAALTFDHAVEHPDRLPAGLVAATDRHRYRAIEHLARVEARGGTELAAPLHEALALLADPSHDRVLVLVTDGQVGNEDQILRDIAPGLVGVRVHTVGIDSAVNAGFLGRLAGVGGGRCELVESEDRLDDAMDRIHRRIGSPAVTGLKIEAEGLDLIPDTASPARVPDLFPGVPLVVGGRYRGSAAGTLTVSGLTPDDLPWQVTVTATVADRPEVAKIWARGRLRDLEDRYVVSGGAELERTIVETSLRHGVLCRFTAYVATDVRVVTDGGVLHKVTQPVEQPAGWEPSADMPDMARERSGGSVHAAALSTASGAWPMPSAPLGGPGGGGPSAAFAPAPAARFTAASGAAPAAPAAPAASPAPAQPSRTMMRKRSRGGEVESMAMGGSAFGSQRAAGSASTGSQSPGSPFVGSQADGSPSAEPEAFGPELIATIEQAAVEASRLRDGAAEPAGRRRDLLDDLASRLDALVHALTRQPADRTAAQALRTLIDLLRDADVPLEERWTRALAALDELAAMEAGETEQTADADPASGQDVDRGQSQGQDQGQDHDPSVVEQVEYIAERRAFWKR